MNILNDSPFFGSCAGVPTPVCTDGIIWRCGVPIIAGDFDSLVAMTIIESPEIINIRSRAGCSGAHFEACFEDGSRFEANCIDVDEVMRWMEFRHVNFSGSILFRTTERGVTRRML